jgi:ribosomal protein L40E
MRTEEMDALDLANLDRWANRHAVTSRPGVQHQGQLTTGSHHTLGVAAVTAPSLAEPLPEEANPIVKMEAGLRVCPRCGKPLHMSATVCRSCGEPVPKC